jgi:hypothetical protein
MCFGGSGGGGGTTDAIPLTPIQRNAMSQLGYLGGQSGLALLPQHTQKVIQTAQRNLDVYLLKIAQLESKHTSGLIDDEKYAEQLAKWQDKQAKVQLTLDTYQPEIDRLEAEQAAQTAESVPDIPAEPVVGMTPTEQAAQDRLTAYATTPFELSGLEQTGQALAGQYANSAQRVIPTLQVAGLTGTEQTIQDQLKVLAGQNLLPSSFTGANSELQKILGGKTEQQLLESPAMKAAQLLQAKQLEDANTSTIAANRRNIGAGGVGRLLQTNKQNETINLAQELGRQSDLAQQAQMQALNLAPSYFNFEQFAPTQKLAGMDALAQKPRDIANQQNQATYNQQSLQKEANIQDILSKMGVATQYGEFARQAEDKDTAAKLAQVQQYGGLPRQLEQAQQSSDWQAQLQQLLFPYQTQAPILQNLLGQQMYSYQPAAQQTSPWAGLMGAGAGALLTGGISSLFAPAAAGAASSGTAVAGLPNGYMGMGY